MDMTTVIAVSGLLLALVSLGWQLAEHRLAGPRVRAELFWGVQGSQGRVVGPVRGKLPDLDLARPGGGPGLAIMGVRARNVGRLPIDITDFRIEVDGGLAYSLPDWGVNPAIPHRLEAGSATDFLIPLADVHATVATSQELMGITRGRLRGRVVLATGQQVVSPWTNYPLPAAD